MLLGPAGGTAHSQTMLRYHNTHPTSSHKHLQCAISQVVMRDSACDWLLLAVLLAAAGTAAHSQPLKPNHASDQELAPNTTLSGLNLVPSVNGTGAFPGRVFDSTGPDGVAALLTNISDPAGWSDTFTCVQWLYVLMDLQSGFAAQRISACMPALL